MVGPGVDDETFATIVDRRATLSALTDGPKHRTDLESTLDVSTSTCHRIVRALEDEDILERTEAGYALTALGRVVHSQVATFEETIRGAYRLEPLLRAFEGAALDFDVDLFADATVTRAEPDDPTPPVDRYLELYRDADEVHTIDCTSFVPPLYIEKIYELAERDDKNVSAVYPKSVVEKRFDEYPELHRAAARSHDPAYRVCNGIPFGMTLYDDDHVGLRAYDSDSGALLLFADTGDPDAVAWAHDVYDHYHEQSDPLSAVDDLPDWDPDEI